MKKIIVLLLLIFVSLLIFGAQKAKKIEAGASDNVSGWAWSENIGWISFNNTTGGGATNYGVNINPSTGIFSGYAWAENIGWLTFNESELAGCPSGICQAKLDLGTNEVSGWAKVLSNNNWIRLRGASYGVSWNNTAQELQGWAWSDTDVGWVSFNCANQGVCGTSNYKVLAQVNNLPSAINLSAAPGNYCFASSPPIILSWDFNDPGDTQSAYQVHIATTSDFSSIAVDSGKLTSASESYAPAGLSYSKAYYWRVKVWDSKDAVSNWATGTSFTTAAHAYPRTNFTFSPSAPTVNEMIQFTDQTVFYDGAVGWSWNFGDGSATSTQNPTHSYSKNGAYSATLNACDSIGCCSISKDAKVSSSLPKWREIPPY